RRAAEKNVHHVLRTFRSGHGGQFAAHDSAHGFVFFPDLGIKQELRAALYRTSEGHEPSSRHKRRRELVAQRISKREGKRRCDRGPRDVRGDEEKRLHHLDQRAFFLPALQRKRGVKIPAELSLGKKIGRFLPVLP